MYLRQGDISWETPRQGTAVAAVIPRPVSIEPPPPPFRLPSITLNGVRLHAITEKVCIEQIMRQLAAGRGGVVVTPNLDHLRRCRRDLSFAALVAEADLVVADGMPLVWASRLQGTPLPQRIAGSDLISTLSAAAAGEGRSIFLLGGAVGAAEAAADVLHNLYPQLNIAGTYCPPVGFERDAQQISKMLEQLTSARPDIVYVALGSPKQEQLIDRIRRNLPKSWWLGVGVSFSFLSGDVRRAPVWMRRTGLEWVHRLTQEPRRLFKRYIVVGLPFATALLGRATIKGLVNRVMGRPETEHADDHSVSARIAPAVDAAPLPSPAQAVRSVLSELSETAVPASQRPAGLMARPVQLSDPEALKKLRGVVLMAGMVRPTPLAAAVGRNVLDLPVGNGETILTRWLEQASDVARYCGLASLPVRILVDRAAVEPRSAAHWTGKFTLERDLSEYRGTGGLLANAAANYDDDDLILVGNAAQLLLSPLTALVRALRRTGGAISLVGHRDGTPNGLMLVTCKTLRLIPKVGFVDMKEQAMPEIASKYDVRVLNCRRPTGLPIRSLSDYIAALRAYHSPAGVVPASADPLAEDWKSTFVIVEPGATVAPTARVYDSVILTGGTIEAGAVVVRSLIVDGGALRKDRKAVDRCVTPDSK